MRDSVTLFALLFVSVISPLGVQVSASPPLPEPRDTLVELRERYNIQLDIVDEKVLLGGKMLPVGTKKPGYHIWEDRENRYNNQPSYHFYMKDGNAERVELSSIYTTKDAVKHLDRRELKEHANAKSIYHFGTGFVERGKPWVYEYGLWIPSSMDETTEGIISQWHGTADRTSILTPEGEVITYALRDFNRKVLSKMKFIENIGIDLKSGKPNGYYVDQGGYPPLSLKVGGGYLHLLARADFSRVTDKSDRVNLKPHEIGVVKYSPRKSKMVTIPFRKKLDQLAKDRWINVKWEIRWSEWDGPRSLKDGTIKLHLDGEKMLDWVGPIGNNDKHGTYFKYGVYKAGESGIEVKLGGYRQYPLQP